MAKSDISSAPPNPARSPQPARTSQAARAPQPAHSSTPVNLDLVRKYAEVAAPRYTSYPPATKFTENMAAVRFEDAIRDDNSAGAQVGAQNVAQNAARDNANAATNAGAQNAAQDSAQNAARNAVRDNASAATNANAVTNASATTNASAAAAANAGAAPRPLSIYFHLPFCEARCWYCGCTTIVTQNHGAADAYLDDLEREMELVARLLDPKRRVVQLHLGGGTPTFLTPAQLRRLNDLIRAHFTCAPDAEVSVEIDPRKFTQEHVRALRELGATRASLGVQDTDRRVQLAVHRRQPHELNVQAVAWLREAGFLSINVDLIHGLPLQTAASFERTLDDALALSPDRFSIFSYAHVPWIKPAQRIFEDRGQLPEAEEKLAMFALAHERLTAAGFVDIGLDHFAKRDDELAVALREGTLQRNFQGYSTRGGASLYAFGMSSISQTPDAYWQNTKDMTAYHAMLAEGRLPVVRGLRVSDEDKRRRAIIMRVMCARRLDYAQMSAELGVNFEQAYARELESMSDLVADGIVRLTPKSLEVTPAGVPLLRLAAMRFDAHLPKAAQAAHQHARAI